MKKRVIVSVSNDLFTDQRVNKICKTIESAGFDVLVIGRILPNSQNMPANYFKHKRMKLMFNTGFLFYAELNIRLFFRLLFSKFDILYSNDLDTLLPNYICSKLFYKPLIYDSHELFTEVPELENRFAKKVWLKIEAFIFPRLKNVITVNQSIADFYENKYGTHCKVVRNVPSIDFKIVPFSKKEFNIAENDSIIILQGAGINMHRGSEEAVEMMKYIKNAVLFIVGGGDVIEILKEKVIEGNLENKVRFFEKQNYSNLLSFTAMADIGLSLDKDTNLNYHFSLPNKLFDYIHAGTPVLTSNLVEIAKIVELYKIGRISNSHDPKVLAQHCNEMLSVDFKSKNKEHLKMAASELNWQKESITITNILGELIKCH